MAIEHWDEFVRAKLRRKISTNERRYWANLWYAAATNMPCRKPSDRGWTTLHLLLGYKITDPNGRNAAAQHASTAAGRGYKPRKPEQQRLLKMFAGHDGTTLVRAVAIHNGIDLSAYKHWPD